MLIKDIMETNLITVNPYQSVRQATDLMQRYRINGLPVLHKDNLVGIITSRDIKENHPNRLVADAMSKKVKTVSPYYSIWQAKKLMEEHDIERLPIIENGRLVGLVTKGTLLAELNKYFDPLTGLNRREYLCYKVLDLLQEHSQITIIFLDLNNFGNIDKQFGHVLGDEVLKQTARILKDIVEKNDSYLCRYGGDEFVIASVKPLDDAVSLAQKIIAIMPEQKWPRGIKVSFSVGIASKKIFNNQQIDSAVYDIINAASLASTKAKSALNSLVIVEL
ncbi:diguanylate cyclase (GGDEF)-like protein [Desulfohalotomaculum tongense]|uniref:GGDEF domain-containing protein n=1 Tax=Desulforadius tongensis TaxID=1216062 RepID=UPI001958B851|nr:GGDEF domain-containing protein [Desulforadius tongensis]MBM7854790.1 diguanylate cyclase (GGDEF)-like protein [Desulforadius tongensis]